MTQWTQEQYENLSRKVAEKFSIPECKVEWVDDIHFTLWLHNDWTLIMDLCVEHGVWSMPDDKYVISFYRNDGISVRSIIDHSKDKSLAERVARMLALLEVDNE